MLELRLGGVLTNILGTNSLRIPDGLMRGRSAGEILDSLGGHASRNRKLLEARPDAYTLWRLSDLLQGCDRTCLSIEDAARLLELSPAGDPGAAAK